MYRPTSPLRFAKPFGKRELRESSSKCGLHAYPDANTNTGARNSTASPVARFTPHTAFDDPTTPEGTPPRESIEFRTIAFFD